MKQLFKSVYILQFYLSYCMSTEARPQPPELHNFFLLYFTRTFIYTYLYEYFCLELVPLVSCTLGLKMRQAIWASMIKLWLYSGLR
jgi:hypothetical protein